MQDKEKTLGLKTGRSQIYREISRAEEMGLKSFLPNGLICQSLTT